jgi:hypothetical protein
MKASVCATKSRILTVGGFLSGGSIPLLWAYNPSHRKVLFRLARVLKMEATSQDHALLDALGANICIGSNLKSVSSIIWPRI